MTDEANVNGIIEGRIHRELVGRPTGVGGRKIRPVARVKGRQMTGGDGKSRRAGAWLRITPVEVVVREDDGSEHVVPIVDATREAMRGIFAVSALVALVSSVIILVFTLKRVSGRPA